MKVDYSSKIHLEIILFSLLANTLETILYKILQREIGRRSFIDCGSSHFGIKTIIVSFKVGEKVPRVASKDCFLRLYQVTINNSAYVANMRGWSEDR